MVDVWRESTKRSTDVSPVRVAINVSSMGDWWAEWPYLTRGVVLIKPDGQLGEDVSDRKWNHNYPFWVELEDGTVAIASSDGLDSYVRRCNQVLEVEEL